MISGVGEYGNVLVFCSQRLFLPCRGLQKNKITKGLLRFATALIFSKDGTAMKKVAIVMGSDSDLPVVSKAIKKLKEFGIEVEAHVMSAHRTPDAAAEFSKNAAANGFGVIISAAGKAAHLGGVLAAHTTLPVIGIPIKSSTLDGLDALLATVQMPAGIPVATVAIDGAENAAILAVQMLALSEPVLADKLTAMKEDMAKKVLEKDAALAAQVAEL